MRNHWVFWKQKKIINRLKYHIPLSLIRSNTFLGLKLLNSNYVVSLLHPGDAGYVKSYSLIQTCTNEIIFRI